MRVWVRVIVPGAPTALDWCNALRSSDANPGGENRSRSATNVSQGALQAIIMDFSRVSQVDLTTCREVKTVIEEFEERGVTLVFAAVPGPTRDTMRAAGM